MAASVLAAIAAKAGQALASKGGQMLASKGGSSLMGKAGSALASKEGQHLAGQEAGALASNAFASHGVPPQQSISSQTSSPGMYMSPELAEMMGRNFNASMR